MFTRLAIHPPQAPFFPDLLTAIYRFRKKVFVDGQGWPLTVHSDGGERDRFDNDEAIYVAVMANGAIRACARLNPAENGLLTQVFADIIETPLDDGVVRLECSRFAVDPDLARSEQRLWSARLLWSASLAARSVGAAEFVSLSDPVMARLVRRIGGDPRRLGRPHTSAEGHSVMAMRTPIADPDIARIAARADLPPEHREDVTASEP